MTFNFDWAAAGTASPDSTHNARAMFFISITTTDTR